MLAIVKRKDRYSAFFKITLDKNRIELGNKKPVKGSHDIE